MHEDEQRLRRPVARHHELALDHDHAGAADEAISLGELGCLVVADGDGAALDVVGLT